MHAYMHASHKLRDLKNPGTFKDLRNGSPLVMLCGLPNQESPRKKNRDLGTTAGFTCAPEETGLAGF
jgi:hypothetical protein